MAERQKILLVGWDVAELSVIMPLVDAGEMPHFEKLLNHGAIGKLNTMQPLFSPLLWNSVATGKPPRAVAGKRSWDSLDGFVRLSHSPFRPNGTRLGVCRGSLRRIDANQFRL
jgi:predicted AlkP superfamily phosphohydrolase/phosphomutase